MSVCVYGTAPSLVKVRLWDFLPNTTTQSRFWLKPDKANRYCAWVCMGGRKSIIVL